MTRNSIHIARRLRKESTAPEAVLWRELRASRLDGLKFRRQTPIAGYIVDFCCYDLCLTIELDGKHHAGQLLADARWRAAIEASGYLELRFTNDEGKERHDWVQQEIRRARRYCASMFSPRAVSQSGAMPAPFGRGFERAARRRRCSNGSWRLGN